MIVYKLNARINPTNYLKYRWIFCLKFIGKCFEKIMLDIFFWSFIGDCIIKKEHDIKIVMIRDFWHEVLSCTNWGKILTKHTEKRKMDES